jgi:hypothetical protein
MSLWRVARVLLATPCSKKVARGTCIPWWDPKYSLNFVRIVPGKPQTRFTLSCHCPPYLQSRWIWTTNPLCCCFPNHQSTQHELSLHQTTQKGATSASSASHFRVCGTDADPQIVIDADDIDIAWISLLVLCKIQAA